jgi:general secretion pathway protein C
VKRTVLVGRSTAARQLLPRDVYFWLKALLLALVAVQLARLVWALLTPLGPLGQWLPPVPAALPLAARTALLTSFDPFAGAVPAPAQPAAAPVTGFTLFGTRLGASGSAVIAGADGVQNSYGIGEEIAPGVRLAAVGFDFVMLDSGGQQQRLAMPGAEEEAVAASAAGGASSASAPAGRPSAPMGSVTPDAIRQNIAFAPRNSGGRITGLLVSPIGNDASLRAAGLQNGDVIVAVNGRRIGSAGDAAALQSQLVPGARLSLQVERGAAVVPVALLLAGPQ